MSKVDVTVIYPAPSANELDELLEPSDPGLGGALPRASSTKARFRSSAPATRGLSHPVGLAARAQRFG